MLIESHGGELYAQKQKLPQVCYTVPIFQACITIIYRKADQVVEMTINSTGLSGVSGNESVQAETIMQVLQTRSEFLWPIPADFVYLPQGQQQVFSIHDSQNLADVHLRSKGCVYGGVTSRKPIHTSLLFTSTDSCKDYMTLAYNLPFLMNLRGGNCFFRLSLHCPQASFYATIFLV